MQFWLPPIKWGQRLDMHNLKSLIRLEVAVKIWILKSAIRYFRSEPNTSGAGPLCQDVDLNNSVLVKKKVMVLQCNIMHCNENLKLCLDFVFRSPKKLQVVNEFT